MEERGLDPRTIRYLITFLIVTLLFLFLVVVNGAILTTDWIRIYSYVVIFEWIFILTAIGSDRVIADFRFIKGLGDSYEFLNRHFSGFYLDVVFGIGFALLLLSGQLLNLSIGILPAVSLSTGGAISLFAVMFIAPFIEESLISGTLVPSAKKWFSRLGLGYMVFLTGIAITFLLYVTVASVNVVGVFLIFIGIIMMFVYPLNTIALRDENSRWFAAIFFAAVFFAGLHAFAFQTDPNFALDLIAVFLFAFLVNIGNIIRNSIAFSLTAHMIYNGISYTLISNGNWAFFLIIAVLYLIILREISDPTIMRNRFS